MPITTAEVTALSHRLALIEALLPLIQRLTEPLLTEGVLEATPPDGLALTREAIATLAAPAPLASSIEGVTIPKAMKDAWAAGLETHLAALDAALAALPADK